MFRLSAPFLGCPQHFQIFSNIFRFVPTCSDFPAFSDFIGPYRALWGPMGPYIRPYKSCWLKSAPRFHTRVALVPGGRRLGCGFPKFPQGRRQNQKTF